MIHIPQPPTKPIITLKGYPLSNEPMLTLKGCPQIILKGESSDYLDYHMVSQTYHIRNNPQPTTSLPPSQCILPSPPHLSSLCFPLSHHSKRPAQT